MAGGQYCWWGKEVEASFPWRVLPTLVCCCFFVPSFGGGGSMVCCEFVCEREECVGCFFVLMRGGLRFEGGRWHRRGISAVLTSEDFCRCCCCCLALDGLYWHLVLFSRLSAVRRKSYNLHCALAGFETDPEMF